jgi:hypothetical protein
MSVMVGAVAVVRTGARVLEGGREGDGGWASGKIIARSGKQIVFSKIHKPRDAEGLTRAFIELPLMIVPVPAIPILFTFPILP